MDAGTRCTIDLPISHIKFLANMLKSEFKDN